MSVFSDDGYMTVGHILRSIPTNGHRFTALGLPWRSPLQVLTEVDEHATELAFFATESLESEILVYAVDDQEVDVCWIIARIV